MRIKTAGIDDEGEVARLFNDYRRFYQQPDDLAGCRRFIHDRLANDESTVFLALADTEHAIGFTQLYHSFCSVSMAPIVYLYDLYVAPEARRVGVAQALMAAARDHGITCGANRLQLETATDNHPAQSLYERLGWQRDDQFYTYSLALEST